MVTHTRQSDQSTQLFNKAQHYIPGGVNSPVRAFTSVGGSPRFIKAAKGAYLRDVNDVYYIDYVGSWGPMILGHAHQTVIKAVQETILQGLSFGAPCELEIALAEKICELVPSIEKVRMVNSGTEAAMSTIRMARGVTGKDKIIKFEGCYHGHADSLLVKSGSGTLTFGSPSSPGVPKNATKDTLVASYNDIDSVVELFEKYGRQIAGVIVEPIAGNMSTILPQPGFLQGLRDLCDHYNSLLIFDEVISGFRVARGGAQSLYQITPDLTILGKIIGGGMPVGAFGGKSEYMDALSPQGKIYQAGTLSGNPIAMVAGLTTLQEIQKISDFYEKLNTLTAKLTNGLLALAENAKIPLTINQTCGLFGLFFTKEKTVTQYEQVMQCNHEQFKQFFHGLLKEGIYFAPSAFESAFTSIAHGEKEIAKTLEAVERVLNGLSPSS